MANYRHNGHTVSSLTCHLVWATKYRYEVLQGDIQKRCRELLIQICNSEDVHILKGVVSKDHVHMHIEYSPHQSISLLVKKLKGLTSHHLQQWCRIIWIITAIYRMQMMTHGCLGK